MSMHSAGSRSRCALLQNGPMMRVFGPAPSAPDGFEENRVTEPQKLLPKQKTH
jgi:hypothetical protein